MKPPFRCAPSATTGVGGTSLAPGAPLALELTTAPDKVVQANRGWRIYASGIQARGAHRMSRLHFHYPSTRNTMRTGLGSTLSLCTRHTRGSVGPTTTQPRAICQGVDRAAGGRDGGTPPVPRGGRHLMRWYGRHQPARSPGDTHSHRVASLSPRIPCKEQHTSTSFTRVACSTTANTTVRTHYRRTIGASARVAATSSATSSASTATASRLALRCKSAQR